MNDSNVRWSQAMTTLVFAAAGLLLAIGSARAAEPLAVPAFDAEPAGTSLPAIAAEYRSTLRDGTSDADAEVKVSTWRFWRAADRIERENPVLRTGELWQSDGSTIFLTRLYHADRKGIEYRNDDLAVLNASPQWAQLALLIDPALPGKLAPLEATWKEGVPLRRYEGEVDGTRWELTVRTDYQLPTRVVRTRGVRVERLELLQATSGDRAPWQAPSIAGYEIIDHADLGDRERDPFVMRISADEGYGHGYGHEHRHSH